MHPTVYGSGIFSGQVVVVSGGAGGIGRATAWLFARLGAHVVVAGRSEGKIAEVVRAITAGGYACSGETVDIRDPDSVPAFFDRVWTAHGRLDALVNSAGGQFPQAAIDYSQEKVTGTVRLKLYKGNVIVVGRKSPYSLYSEKVVTFEDDAGAYDQRDAAGFIKLNALRLRLLGRRDL